MSLKKGQQVVLRVEKTAFGGKGIARINEMALFIDGGVPGDLVRCRVTKKKKSFAEARVIEIIEPSPLRIDAPCRYFGICGGCRWQVLPYEKQLAYKKDHIRETLAHIAGIQDVLIDPPVGSEKIYGYRNKMEFSFSDRRWLTHEEMQQEHVVAGMGLGLHVPGTFYKVLDIDGCLLQPEEGNGILKSIKKEVKKSGLPAYGIRSHRGFWRFFVLRHSVSCDSWMINLVTGHSQDRILLGIAERIMKKHPSVVSFVNNVSEKKAQIAVGDYEKRILGQSFLTERLGRFEFFISANSFFQTNTRQARVLCETVAEFAGLDGDENLLDLYCGAGSFAIYLSDYAKRVTGIEVSQAAIKDAVKNAHHNSVANCEFVCADVKDALAGMDERFDLVIIDPPRAGMHKTVLRSILETSVRKIVYVSCNPATMARDLIELTEKYVLKRVRPIDMFPHTYHVESVCLLEKKG